MNEIKDKRNWKIIYSNYSGAEKKAVELISSEMGSQILRDSELYIIHVLACEHIKNAVIDKNAVIIGTYEENELVRKYIKKSEIPENGYVVKVMDNPELEDAQLVIITAENPREVFYGAVDFTDDYFTVAAPEQSWAIHYYEIFKNKLPEYYNASAPQINKRCIFTWGHPINDYVDYLAKMARMKLNVLILWNDYIPINIDDVIYEAKQYGIEVYLGYSWGWDEAKTLNIADSNALAAITEKVVEQYEQQFAALDIDGIYFQSFTEFNEEYIGDKMIAEVVTDFVNDTASKILDKHPGLAIQFGLHASSVKKRLEIMKNIDSRITIVWEDCGVFPFSYRPYVENEAEYEETMDFVENMLTIRENCVEGLLFKGQNIMDWHVFAHQSGPFVMGKSSKLISEKDREFLLPSWRRYQTEWIRNGLYAYNATKRIRQATNGNVILGMAGQFAGGMWMSEALCAQMLWECDKPYDEIFNKVSRRRCVEMV